MRLSGHEIGVLKEYVRDLIEQARNEHPGQQNWSQKPYTLEEAMMDLMALLDDRVESEGVLVGLSEDFPHRMWKIFYSAERHLADQFWLASQLQPGDLSKIQVRERVYSLLLEHIEKNFF